MADEVRDEHRDFADNNANGRDVLDNEHVFDKEKEEEAIENDLMPSRSMSTIAETYEPINPGDDTVLVELSSRFARTQSHRTQRTGSQLERTNTLDGLAPGAPEVDPNNPKFDLYKYLRWTMSILDQDGIKIKRAGVVIKDVNVSGTGPALNLQGTVSSFLTSFLRIGEAFHHPPAKRILRNFNGVLKSGELLVVLGRPGSGCISWSRVIYLGLC